MDKNNYKFVCEIDCKGVLQDSIRKVEERLKEIKKEIILQIGIAFLILFVMFTILTVIITIDSPITIDIVFKFALAILCALILYIIFWCTDFWTYFDVKHKLLALKNIKNPTFKNLSECKAVPYDLRVILEFVDIINSREILDIEDFNSTLRVIYRGDCGIPESVALDYELSSFSEEAEYFIIRKCGMYACSGNRNKPTVSMTCIGGA